MKSKPNFDIENQLSGLVVGIDEVGCGPWGGPVVASAVYIDQHLIDLQILVDINDSKKISASKRESIFEHALNANGFYFGIGQCSSQEIDKIGLGPCIKKAMQKAIEKLPIKANHILIDGIRKPDLQGQIQTIIKGDQKSISIAAASIMAKVTRDRIMQDLHHLYPHYGWNSNAGYGTKAHISALTIHGPCEHHRFSFKPIKDLI